MNCPNCNQTLQKGMTFCPNCGTNVKDITDKAECPACRQVNDPDATYCKRCGCNMQTGQPVTVVPQPSNRMLWPSLLIVVWFLLLIVLTIVRQVCIVATNEWYGEPSLRIAMGIIGIIDAVILLLPAIAVPHKWLRIAAIVLALPIIIYSIINSVSAYFISPF